VPVYTRRTYWKVAPLHGRGRISPLILPGCTAERYGRGLKSFKAKYAWFKWWPRGDAIELAELKCAISLRAERAQQRRTRPRTVRPLRYQLLPMLHPTRAPREAPFLQHKSLSCREPEPRQFRRPRARVGLVLPSTHRRFYCFCSVALRCLTIRQALRIGSVYQYFSRTNMSVKWRAHASARASTFPLWGRTLSWTWCPISW